MRTYHCGFNLGPEARIHHEIYRIPLESEHPLRHDLPRILRRAKEHDVANADRAPAGGESIHEHHVAGQIERRDHAGPPHLTIKSREKVRVFEEAGPTS